jgi:fatty acid desaturase
LVEISRTEYMTGRAKQREAKQLAIASAGSRSAYAIPVALLAFVLAYFYWPLRLVALVVAYMYWRNSR